MTDPTFSLIFVNYQSAKHLTRALCSWQRVFSEAEFVVVNNDKNEQAVLDRLAKEHPFRLINLPNVGFGTACNEGSRVARGDYLFFLNPDTEYLSGSIKGLELILKSRPQSIGGVGLVGANLYEEAWSSGKFPNIWRIADKLFFGSPKKPYWCRKTFDFPQWVSGAALVVKRDFFSMLGGFDENFFLYFEDVDLCHRAKLCGGEVWRTPFFQVKHLGGSSHTEKKEQKRAYYRSQEHYFSKYRPAWEFWLLKLAHRMMFH